MKVLEMFLVLSLVMGISLSPAADAGILGKAFSRSMWKTVMQRNVTRNAATLAKPLAKPRKVFRYTSAARAANESQHGLAPGRHTTSVARPGRPLSAEAAQKRFGLEHKPEVRETIRLPQGFPAKFNKVLQGSPGYGQITSDARVSHEAITGIVRYK